MSLRQKQSRFVFKVAELIIQHWFERAFWFITGLLTGAIIMVLT